MEIIPSKKICITFPLTFKVHYQREHHFLLPCFANVASVHYSGWFISNTFDTRQATEVSGLCCSHKVLMDVAISPGSHYLDLRC